MLKAIAASGDIDCRSPGRSTGDARARLLKIGPGCLAEHPVPIGHLVLCRPQIVQTNLAAHACHLKIILCSVARPLGTSVRERRNDGHLPSSHVHASVNIVHCKLGHASHSH
jgi:hypothetical protein